MSNRSFKNNKKTFLNLILNKFGLTISRESAAYRWDGLFRLLNKYNFKINTFVNVGFAYGTNHIFKHISPKNVICIDPLPESFENMNLFKKKYLKKNPDSLFMIFNLALGEKKSKGLISVFKDIASSTFLEQEGYGSSECLEKIEVDIVPFDELKIDIQNTSLLKIDAQGYELPILRGMKESINKFDYVIIESRFIETLKDSGTFHDLYQLMTFYKFRILDILSLTRRPLDNATTEVDIIFCKEENKILNMKRWS